jgi:hypothetical protein
MAWKKPVKSAANWPEQRFGCFVDNHHGPLSAEAFFELAWSGFLSFLKKHWSSQKTATATNKGARKKETCSSP